MIGPVILLRFWGFWAFGGAVTLGSLACTPAQAGPTQLTSHGLVLTKHAPKVLPKTELASFAAGCFWGIEQEFRKKTGVIATAVGFMGGNTKNPTYEDVCNKNTGHAEIVQI